MTHPLIPPPKHQQQSDAAAPTSWQAALPPHLHNWQAPSAALAQENGGRSPAMQDQVGQLQH